MAFFYGLFALFRTSKKKGGPMVTRLPCRRDRFWQTILKAVYVGRPSRWGYPYRVGRDGTAEECVNLFVQQYEHDTAYRAALSTWVLLWLRAYPNRPGRRYVIEAQAKCQTPR